MNLCFLVPWITKGRGGTENVGQMMANAMQARGHAVQIITFDDARQPARWPLVEGIRLHYVTEEPGQRQQDQLLLLLGSLRPDLVVGLHMNRGLLLYARTAARLGLPLVLSEHCEPRDVFDLGTNSPEEREIAFFAADRVHLVNPALIDTVPEHLQPRCTAVPNTVPAARRTADPAADKPQRTLLTVARLVPRKNLAVLLRSFAAIAADHPDWRLQIVGDGDQMDALRTEADGLGLDDRVVFEGHHDDVYPFYEAADLFTLPSTSEVFGLVMLEAMAHGLPVVAPRASLGAGFVVAHERTGLLCRGGAGGYADCLSRLMGDAELRRQMGAAGAARYAETFSPETVFAAWEALFDTALRDHVPRVRPTRAERIAVRLDDLAHSVPPRHEAEQQRET